MWWKIPHIVGAELLYTVPSKNPPSPRRINDLHSLWSNPPELWHNPPISPDGDHGVTCIGVYRWWGVDPGPRMTPSSACRSGGNTSDPPSEVRVRGDPGAAPPKSA